MNLDLRKIRKAALDADYKYHCDNGGAPLCSDEHVKARNEAVGLAAIAAMIEQHHDHPEHGTVCSVACAFLCACGDCSLVAMQPKGSGIPGPQCPARRVRDG